MKQITLSLLLAIVALFSLACTTSSETTENNNTSIEETTTSAEDENTSIQESKTITEDDNSSIKEYKTKTGETFVVEITKMGSSLCKLKVTAKGFSSEDEIVDFGEIDPIINVWQTDLDQDGRDELFFVTQGVGSGAYGNLYGITYKSDKTVFNIIKLDGDKSFLEGYQGRDTYKLGTDDEYGSVIFNTFPVYKENDSNSKPTGGTRQITYILTEHFRYYSIDAFEAKMID